WGHGRIASRYQPAAKEIPSRLDIRVSIHEDPNRLHITLFQADGETLDESFNAPELRNFFNVGQAVMSAEVLDNVLIIRALH
ncbi:MAG TPA: hypothetical protein VEC99_12485, partial [Clostridia bacterium]|nr:hypothetical protein [Clostridia bacterium]